MDGDFLLGDLRDRIQDLLKHYNVTQADLAAKIGYNESLISRFLSGKTNRLGYKYIICIARVFHVSTDFLLGESNTPDPKNYEIEELGLSVQAAKGRKKSLHRQGQHRCGGQASGKSPLL